MSLLSDALSPIFGGPRKAGADGDGDTGADARTVSPSFGEPAPAEHAGSPPSTQGEDEDDDYCPAPLPVKRVRGIPEIDYPSGLSVKNTFIDVDRETWQPSSLDGFLKAREIQSCPPSAIGPGGQANGTPFCSAAESLGVEAEQEEAEAKEVAANTTSASSSAPVQAEGSARSRSTSAGCSSPSNSIGEGASEAALLSSSPASQDADSELPAYIYPASRAARPGKAVKGLPTFEYPSFAVKNTFIHGAIGQPVSLDGFYEEREIRSCPASGIGIPIPPGLEEGENEDADDDDEEVNAAAIPAPESIAEALPVGIPPPPPAPPTLAAPEVPVETAPPPPPLQEPSLGLFAPPVIQEPSFGMYAPPVIQGPPNWFSESVMPLTTANVLSGLPNGLPTIGSEAHQYGECKPCAYASIKGCKNGAQCQFCHLCPPGELKRRQKAKRSNQRALQRSMRS